MSRLAALRVLLAISAASALSACAMPTDPTAPRRTPDAAHRDDICRNGWTESGGFKCIP